MGAVMAAVGVFLCNGGPSARHPTFLPPPSSTLWCSPLVRWLSFHQHCPLLLLSTLYSFLGLRSAPPPHGFHVHVVVVVVGVACTLLVAVGVTCACLVSLVLHCVVAVVLGSAPTRAVGGSLSFLANVKHSAAEAPVGHTLCAYSWKNSAAASLVVA